MITACKFPHFRFQYQKLQVISVDQSEMQLLNSSFIVCFNTKQTPSAEDSYQDFLLNKNL